MQKKNSKLESFLFRNLPEHHYERIRGYESCIVVSEKENKSFKYIVLGDEWIYLTENPPKAIHQSVPLADVISVELVNDFPDFLLGQDKKNSQHLAITYWTSEPVKSRSFRKKKSPRGSISEIHGDRSNASTPLCMASTVDMLNEDYEYVHTSHNHPDSRGSQSSATEIRRNSLSNKKKKGPETVHTIQSESEDMFLKPLKEEQEEDILQDLENPGDSLSMSRSHNANSLKIPGSVWSFASNNNQSSQRLLPDSPLTKTEAFKKSVHLKNGDFGMDSSLPKKKDLSSDKQDSEESDSTNRLSFTGMDGTAERRRTVINLYLLSNVSPMLMLIRSAWSNCLLSSTLMLNPEMIETPKGSILRASQRNKQEQLFQELKRDLFKPDIELEDLYYLFNELKIATERNFALKRLFWKNADFFHFCVIKLQNFLPKSSAGADKSRRSDEFDLIRLIISATDPHFLSVFCNRICAVQLNPSKQNTLWTLVLFSLERFRFREAIACTLLIELLGMMFHETETVQERTAALKAERGRSVVALLRVLVCSPDMPEKHLTAEIEKLLLAFTKTALALVFELFLMAKQANWGFIEDQFLNINWMISTLEEIQHTEMYVNRVIDMVLKTVSPTSTERLSPNDAVLLYQQFFVLDTFLQYSPKMKTVICSTFSEEFKYFIQPPAIMRKLPQTYPVYHILLSQIEEVVKKVIPPQQTSAE